MGEDPPDGHHRRKVHGQRPDDSRPPQPNGKTANRASGMTIGLSHSLVIVTRAASEAAASSENTLRAVDGVPLAILRVVPGLAAEDRVHERIRRVAGEHPVLAEPQPAGDGHGQQKAARPGHDRPDRRPWKSIAATIHARSGTTTNTTAGYLHATAAPARYPANNVKPRPLVAVPPAVKPRPLVAVPNPNIAA